MAVRSSAYNNDTNNNGEQNRNNDPQQQEIESSLDCVVGNDNSSDSVSMDASSLHSFGSIHPDPNYDPVLDPMNPANEFKQFVPPMEIIVKTVRGRRRKMMDRGECSCDEDHRSRSLSPIRRTKLEHVIPSLDYQMSSELFVSDDVFHNDRIYSTNSIIIDDDDLESSYSNDKFNNDVVVECQKQQQQTDKQRKSIMRREFSRKICALKKGAKTYSSKNSSKNNADVTNGKNIDDSKNNNGTSNSTTSGSTADSTNYGSDEVGTNKAKNLWNTNLFTTKYVFAKQKDRIILQSSIVC